MRKKPIIFIPNLEFAGCEKNFEYLKNEKN